ncbi:nitrate- and nitrite sensing domain-containing protein, partial [Craterilacuibacter sp.]|uniref:nitrate- and nitrite sensing domain-containing protein n=1 Tax=Craterilacuibacter sp. TaxID=2870909 RepID=UPI003F3B4D15
MRDFIMLQHLAIRHKLLLLLLPPVFVALALAAYLSLSRYQMLQEYEDARALVAISTDASQMIHALQTERGLSNGFLSASGAPSSALLEAREVSDKAMAQFTRTAHALNETALTAQLTPLVDALKSIEQERVAINTRITPAKQAFAAYSDRIDKLIALVSGVVNISSDSQLVHSGVSLLSLLNEKEFAGRERGYVNGLLAAGSLQTPEQIKMVALSAHQEAYAHAARLIADSAQGERLKQIATSPDAKAVAALREQILAIPAGMPQEIKSEQWFAATTAKIALLKAEQGLILSNLDAYVGQKQQASRQQLWINAGLSVLLTLVLLLAGWRVYLSIHVPLTRLENLMSGMSRDLDLSCRANMAGGDGISRMAQAFDSLVETFGRTLGAVKANTHELLDAARGLT